MKRSKYGNKRTGGFASKKEARRHGELLLLQKIGEISDLKTQVYYDLSVNGQMICAYAADFVYNENGRTIVEDVKGFRTPVYRLKAKLMKAIFGITIKET